MKRALLLLVVGLIAFTSAYAQNSEVETTTQITKAEQFKKDNNFVKETVIYKTDVGTVVMQALLLTDLKSGEKLTALDFSHLEESDEEHEFLGYLDMDEVDDMIVALETIYNEYYNATKNDRFYISYTTPSGIDVFYATITPENDKHKVLLRKKWFKLDDYGVQTCVYSESSSIISASKIPQLVSSMKEAKVIANQFMEN